ncbi:unnamed protein product [Closterium sp. Naga37s-1]|nr:unnamed protein product [Closterium sp. Naga37s-1]
MLYSLTLIHRGAHNGTRTALTTTPADDPVGHARQREHTPPPVSEPKPILRAVGCHKAVEFSEALRVVTDEAVNSLVHLRAAGGGGGGVGEEGGEGGWRGRGGWRRGGVWSGGLGSRCCSGLTTRP